MLSSTIMMPAPSDYYDTNYHYNNVHLHAIQSPYCSPPVTITLEIDYSRYLMDVTGKMIHGLAPRHPLSISDIMNIFNQSRCSYANLLVALLYLVRYGQQGAMRRRQGLMANSLYHGSGNNFLIIESGRQLLVTALMLASKYLHDRTASNKAWATMIDTPVRQLNLTEITFLTTIDHRLAVQGPLFVRWLKYIFEEQRISPYRRSIPRSITVPLSNQFLNQFQDSNLHREYKRARVETAFSQSGKIFYKYNKMI